MLHKMRQQFLNFKDKNMKIYQKLLVPLTLALNFAIAASSSAEVIQVTPKSEPDPLIVRGKSGGEKSSDCGNIAASPNKIIEVKAPLPYVRFSVQSQGQPTLLIEGPSGRRFCVLADTEAGESLEVSGYWEAGKYSLYVGDRANGQHPYTLSISQKQDSQ